MITEDEIRRTLHPEAYEPMRYEPQPPQRDPWWPQVLGAVCALLALVLVFSPLGVK